MTLMPYQVGWLHGKVGHLQALDKTCHSSLSGALDVVVLNLWHIDGRSEAHAH